MLWRGGCSAVLTPPLTPTTHTQSKWKPCILHITCTCFSTHIWSMFHENRVKYLTSFTFLLRSFFIIIIFNKKQNKIEVLLNTSATLNIFLMWLSTIPLHSVWPRQAQRLDTHELLHVSNNNRHLCSIFFSLKSRSRSYIPNRSSALNACTLRNWNMFFLTCFRKGTTFYILL